MSEGTDDVAKLCRQIENLIVGIQRRNVSPNFEETFSQSKTVLGKIFTNFQENSQNIDGKKRIRRETLLKVFRENDVADWNFLTKKLGQRKTNGLDFFGFLRLLELVEIRLKTNKDQVFSMILGAKEKRDENEVRLAKVFQSASEENRPGFVHRTVLDKWIRAAKIITDFFSMNLIGQTISRRKFSRFESFFFSDGILSTRFHENKDFLDLKTFLGVVRRFEKEISVSFNEIVRKLCAVDPNVFQDWKKENRRTSIKTSNERERFLFVQILSAVQKMRETVEESRKLHLTEDERKRLRSLFKEFAAFAYRRQNSRVEPRLTNNVLINWMRECRIFDENYTINELDKDFISILGDFTLNSVYPSGTRDLDFDGFINLIETIAAHKHIRADHLLQMIFLGPRSPLQKSAEFNEHMDRIKLQTS